MTKEAKIYTPNLTLNTENPLDSTSSGTLGGSDSVYMVSMGDLTAINGGLLR
ncbi:hypothetical protein WN943_029319 [Citrus x changshan-huyou]